MTKIKQDIYKIIDSVSDEKAVYIFNILVSVRDLLFDEVEPDEFDKKLLKETDYNDEGISLDKAVEGMGFNPNELRNNS